VTASETAPTRALPRGPHRLAREEVRESQRARMIEAMADAVAAKGYAATTVGDVVAGAGVSRKTFYEHFIDKEAAFLAAWDAGVEMLVAAIRAGAAGRPDPIERLRYATRGYLAALAAGPAFARSFLIEVVAAGPRAEQRRSEIHQQFAGLVRALHTEAQGQIDLPTVPDELFLGSVGAVNEIVSGYVRSGRTEQLPELEDALVYLLVALFAGHEAAAAATSRK
jgi:AcrR family transcriptional regulator